MNLLNTSWSCFGLQNTLVAQLTWLAKLMIKRTLVSETVSFFIRHAIYIVIISVFASVCKITELNKATSF